ncbi:uncharacterized protein TNCV_3046471 [Trichonephila clavipes]|uniref:Uncharacterized protein n=1 Tax=Trichonephila clavipes TaxID=2585209 RepID=A0A8X6RI28_TRICX|nr:uncharacterized protein TNCV_3046471 [Trichonephila clavipes]
MASLVTSSSPVPLKTCYGGQRCTLNLSRAETSSRWCGVVVREGYQLRCVHVTSLWFKITWSIAKGPRVAEQCDVNVQSITLVNDNSTLDKTWNYLRTISAAISYNSYNRVEICSEMRPSVEYISELQQHVYSKVHVLIPHAIYCK